MECMTKRGWKNTNWWPKKRWTFSTEIFSLQNLNMLWVNFSIIKFTNYFNQNDSRLLKELNKINIRSFFDETGPIYHVNKCLHGDYDCRGSFKFVGTLSGKCIKLDINHYDGYDKGVRAYILKVRKMVKRGPRVGGLVA